MKSSIFDEPFTGVFSMVFVTVLLLYIHCNKISVIPSWLHVIADVLIALGIILWIIAIVLAVVDILRGLLKKY